MPPNTERTDPSFLNIKYPINRDLNPKISYKWLEAKRLQDGAEGLWRIHDGIYDFTNFIKLHPGGSDWLRVTKGTDITEAFESHHIRSIAQTILPKYYIRSAKSPRNSPFTFKEDGFYQTLKVKIAEKVKEIDPKVRAKSDRVTDSLLLACLVLVPFNCWVWSQSYLGIIMVAINGYLLSSLTTCAHNYFHRRDNWRMYLFNIIGYNYAEWRVSHALSHHQYTNTLQDIELSMLEPFLEYMPNKNKSVLTQLGALYWPIIFPFSSIFSMLKSFFVPFIQFEGKRVDWSYIIPLIMPTWMYISGGISMGEVMLLWVWLLMSASMFFMVFGLTAGHHGHTNFFSGDIPREKNPDWGLHQMDVIVERMEYTDDHFKSLTRFGDHALHHLFPTLDHAELQLLYPVFLKHCEKFDTQLRTNNFYQALFSQCKQIYRKTPNDFRNKTTCVK